MSGLQTSFGQFADIEIIEKILGGETAWFEILIRRNNPFLYKTGRSCNFSHEDTQDLMQDSFIDAYGNLAKFEHRSSFKTWIIKIMLNKCFQKKEKLSYKKLSVATINDKSTPMFSDKKNNDITEKLAGKELSAVIERALQQLPEKYRLTFSLREMSGMNVSETAETLHITETNVKARLNRAKAMLRKEIEKSYSGEEIFEFNLIYCDAMVNNVMKRIKDEL